jgi:disulfide bond formation protein DsbB
MRMSKTSYTWLAIGLGSAALAAGSLLLTDWLGLHPCHLCIFQRLLFMLMAVLGALAALTRADRVAGSLVVLLGLGGAAAAAYQSWLQAQPPASVSCLAADPSLLERLVDWLGQQAPSLFLATGFCADNALVILGLSLANWSLVSFLTALVTASWALRLGRPRP